MAYDPNKDKVLKEWQEGDLIIGIYRYNGGHVKLGLYREYENSNGTGRRAAGRIDWEDFQAIKSHIEEIEKTMEEA
jgi:hypothetical protein